MKKISLVLSGGGARGYAHIGVIKELVKHFEIVSISGTSMGALIGGLYACGGLKKYEDWVCSIDFLDFLSFYKPPFNLNGEKIFGEIEKIVGSFKIEELPIKFTAVATDLTRKKEVWFQEGDLWQFVRASSSIPGIFEPVIFEGNILVDGGVLNLMPIAPVMSDKTDLIIAVNLYGNREYDIEISQHTKKKQSVLEEFWGKIFQSDEKIKDKSINLMMETIFRYRKAEYSADIEIEIPGNIAKWYDFHKAPELIEIGQKIARDVIISKKGV